MHLGADSTDTVGGRPEEVNPEGRLAVQANYKPHVKLKNQMLVAQGEKFDLRPGMQVVAEIHLGERTIMEYLLSPVQKAVREAGREMIDVNRLSQSKEDIATAFRKEVSKNSRRSLTSNSRGGAKYSRVRGSRFIATTLGGVE